jgi:hypothetical protein
MNHETNQKIISAIIVATLWMISILIMGPLQQTVDASSSFPTFVVNNVRYYGISFSNDGVRVLAVYLQPIVVHVGNFFRLHAMVLNNSPGTISFTAEPCDSTLSVIFNKNVVVKHEVSCDAGTSSTSAAVHLVKLRPGEKVSIIGTSVGTTYQAVAAGPTLAKVTFHYQSGTGANTSSIKSYQFNILHS